MLMPSPARSQVSRHYVAALSYVRGIQRQRSLYCVCRQAAGQARAQRTMPLCAATSNKQPSPMRRRCQREAQITSIDVARSEDDAGASA